MLLHDITDGKYYHDGVEITEEEYAELYAEWQASIPEPTPIDPSEEEVDASEALSILLGGAE